MSSQHAPPASRGSRLEELAGDPRRALWKLSLPMMAGMSLQTAYMLADMYFVGRLGSDALAALAFNLPLFFLALGIVFGLGTGATAAIARHIGADDKPLADSAAEHTVALGLIVSAAVSAVAYLWGRRLLRTLGVPDGLLPLAWDYFSVVATGYVFLVMSTFFRSILAGEGDMKTPMLIQGAGTLLNIVLDPLFIFTFGWGLRGAALATVVSQAAPALVFVYFLFFTRHAYLEFRLEHFRPDLGIIRDIFRVGAPASFSFLVMAVGGLVFNRILVTFSPQAVAAYQVGQRVDHVVLLPLFTIAASVVTLVGMFSGAERFELVRATVRYAVKRAVLIALGFGAFFFALAPSIVRLFSDDPAVTNAGTSYLRVSAFGYPLIAVIMTTGRMLQGLGRGLPMLLLSLLRVVLLGAPLAYVFVFELGKPVEWVWYAMLGGVGATAILASFWLTQALSRVPSAAPAADGGDGKRAASAISDASF